MVASDRTTSQVRELSIAHSVSASTYWETDSGTPRIDRDVALVASSPSTGALLHHVTDHAQAILRGGFRDAEGNYGMVSSWLTGVFVSDEPLVGERGCTRGSRCLKWTCLTGAPLGDFEPVEDGKRYREWCLPGDATQQWVREASRTRGSRRPPVPRMTRRIVCSTEPPADPLAENLRTTSPIKL